MDAMPSVAGAGVWNRTATPGVAERGTHRGTLAGVWRREGAVPRCAGRADTVRRGNGWRW